MVKKGEQKEEETPKIISVVPVMNEDKLKDLSWSLDVQDNKNNIEI